MDSLFLETSSANKKLIDQWMIYGIVPSSTTKNYVIKILIEIILKLGTVSADSTKHLGLLEIPLYKSHKFGGIVKIQKYIKLSKEDIMLIQENLYRNL